MLLRERPWRHCVRSSLWQHVSSRLKALHKIKSLADCKLEPICTIDIDVRSSFRSITAKNLSWPQQLGRQLGS